MREISEVTAAILAIDEGWREGRFEAIGALLEDEAVFADASGRELVRGRESCVASFRGFAESAEVLEFEVTTPEVSIVGDLGIGVRRFVMRYRLEGETYREAGAETLVLRRGSEGWRVAWRSLESHPAGEVA